MDTALQQDVEDRTRRDGVSIDLEAAAHEEAVGAFAGRVMGVLADASTALLLSLGHRTGLFDTLDGRAPSTSQQLADAAGLQERYVREWLGGMLVAGIVEHDPDAGSWWLPAAHGDVLTRRAGSQNLAKPAQLIGLLARVERDVATCFREGGGVPYGAYDEFHELMAEDSVDVAQEVLVDAVVPLVDGLHDRLTAGIRVADIGCGSGAHLHVLAAAYPASTFVGFDIAQEAIGAARQVAADRALDNVTFEVQDVARLGDVGPFDLVTAFDAVHDQVHPARVLDNVARVVADDGVFLMADIKASSHAHENVEIPWAPFLYAVSVLHCMTVSLAEGGTGLGAVWGEQTAVRMLGEAGFTAVDVRAIDGDPFNSFYIARRR